MNELTEINNLTELHSKISVSGTSAGRKNYRLINCRINFHLNITDANLINFTDCIFTDKFSLRSNVETSSSFSGTTFEKEVTFENSIFERKVNFQSTKFQEKVNFDNTRFKDNADFWGAEFNKPVTFYKTEFLGAAVFSTTKFKENVLFTYATIDKELVLRGTNFDKGIDLSLATLNGNLSTFDIRLDDFDTVEDFDKEKDYDESVSKKYQIPIKNKKETFRIIKKHLQNQGNTYDSLIYSSLETRAYFKQIEHRLFKKKEIKILQDFLILKLNYYSNKNGKSWIRGVIFTLAMGCLFTYLSILSTEIYYFSFERFKWSDFEQGITFVFNSLLPTHDIEYMKGLKPTTMFYIWDFIGRTFIAYGIYQTVQAFRKFKNL